jgi:hypothetical protein
VVEQLPLLRLKESKLWLILIPINLVVRLDISKAYMPL